MAPHGSRLIVPVPAAAAEPVVNALLTHKQAADSVAFVAAVVFGSERAPSPWEQPCYFRPLVQLTSSQPLHKLDTLMTKLGLAGRTAALLGGPAHPYQIEFFILNCKAFASGPWSPGTNAGREPNPEAGF